MKRKVSMLLIMVCILGLVGCGASESIGGEVETEYFSETVGADESVDVEEVTEEQWDLIPMVMVNGELYLDTGKTSDALRCGLMDGKITSSVDGSLKPTEDNQSNFGTGYGYQYGTGGTIEIFLNEEWRIFATEEAREKIQFPDASQEQTPEPKWGVILTAKNITPTGLTIVCTQAGGEPTGKLQTGSYYTIEKKTDGNWEKVEWLPQEYDVGWTAEAWIIPMDSSVEWEVNWEWLYGSLSAGTYRIGKEVMDFRGAGDYDQEFFYAKFEMTE